MYKKLAFLAAAGVLVCTGITAATVPYLTFWDPTNGTGSANGLIGSMNSTITPGSMAQFMVGRNLLDNGDMWVNQRAATATCGTTTTSGMTAAANYSADRWLCDANITTGAGQLAVATSSPTPPVGFINESTLVRNSGALLAPQCSFQELNTYKSTAIAGQVVNFSVYAQALAGLAADNGNQAFLEVITGTDAAGGFGLRGAKGMATSTKASSFTISTTTGLITNATAVVAGQPITITAATIPTGFTQGATYYVSTTGLNSGTAFSVATTYAGALAGQVLIPSGAGGTNVLNYTPAYPAWTTVAVFGANNSGAGQASVGQAFGQVESNQVVLSATNWGRISTGPVSIPTGTTEVAVGVCFAPAGTTSGGSTDGIAFTGAQLEVMAANQTAASPYEFKSPTLEAQEAYRYYFVLNDAANGTPIGPMGTLLTTTTCGFVEQFPVQMDAAPVYESIGTITTTTFHIYVAADTSTLTAAGITAATLSTINAGGFTATLTTASTAGWACQLTGQTASAAIGLAWTADF